VSKIYKFAALLASLVGGWWSLMSGAISIPIAVLAIYFGGSPGFWLAVLAFAALWVIVIRTAWKNYQMMEKLEVQKTITVKPLRISALPAHRFSSKWDFAVEVEIHNDNQSVSGVRVRLTNIEPPFDDFGGSGADTDLEGIEFPLIGSSDGVLHKDQACRIRLFFVNSNGGITIRFPQKENDYPISFRPKHDQNHKPVEHILTLAAFATGVDANVVKFKLIFQPANQDVPVKLE
jgi:hypothetical protein